MPNVATPEEMEKLRRLREQVTQEMNAVIKAQYKEDVRATIQGMLEKNATADDIVQAIEAGGYFYEAEEHTAASAEPEPSPEPESPLTRRDEYMEAANRQMPPQAPAP